MYGYAKLGQNCEVTVNGVRAFWRARRKDIVVKSRAFTRAFAEIVEPDAELRVGEPGKKAATGETLQINGPIEMFATHRPGCRKKFRPIAKDGFAFARECKNAGEVGIVFEQRN